MKNLFFTCLLILPITVICQISPSTSAEYCPNTEIDFSVNIGSDSLDGVEATGGVFRYDVIGETGVITWKGQFADIAAPQGFKVHRKGIGPLTFTYNKIKSLQGFSCQLIVPNHVNLNVPRCATSNINISFDQVQYDGVPCFGTLTEYEYLLPSGWSMGSSTSTGSNWITGSNNVTISANSSSPAIDYINIRPKNTCGLASPAIPKTINISRPRPTLSISGDDIICSGSENYTIPGLPGYASVSWSLSTDGSTSIPTNPYSGSSVNVTKTGNGYSTLTANITDCLETYSLPTQNITAGIPDIDRFIVYGQDFDYTSGGATYYYLVCPDEYLIVVPEVGISQILENSWEYVSGSYNAFSGGNVTTASIETASSIGTALVAKYRFRNACGWSDYEHVYFTNMDCEGGEEPWRVGTFDFDFEVSPNPASSKINIVLSRELQDFDVSIFDLQTGELKNSRNYKKSSSAFDININNLKPGQYGIQINSGKYLATKQITVF